MYQAAVLRVQQHTIQDACPVLASIQHHLSEFTVVLPAVHAVLWQLVTSPAPQKGSTAALDALFARSRCGMPALRAVTDRLLWHCNQLLYQHVTAWCALSRCHPVHLVPCCVHNNSNNPGCACRMVHGLLLASNFEFFITCVDPQPAGGVAEAAALADAASGGNMLLAKDESGSDEAAWASFVVKVRLWLT